MTDTMVDGAPARGPGSTVTMPLPDTASRLPVPSSRLSERLADCLGGTHPARAAAVTAGAGFGVLLALTLLAGWFVRDVLGGGVVGDWDAEVADWFAARRGPTLNTVSYIGSHVAGIWEVPVGMAIAIGVLFALPRTWWASFLLIGILVEGAIYSSTTFLFARERPAVPRLEDLIRSDSFPSGHSAAAVVMYGGFALVVAAATRNRGWRALAWTAAIVVPPFVAFSRIYRGMHYVTDAVVGLCIGVACLAIALTAVRVGSTVAVRRRAATR
jgi:undecaprenyl-diphosphatase